LNPQDKSVGSDDPEQRAFEAAIGDTLSKMTRPLRGLEMFSRDGSWSTAAVLSHCDKVQCWEINSKYIPDLKRNIQNAEVHQVDSIAHARQCRDRFDFISVDAPQGTFGPYCEHFEALPAAAELLADSSVLAFVVNVFPHQSRVTTPPKDDYGMLDHAEWSARRIAFYGRDAAQLEPDFVQKFYTNYFANKGLRALLFRSFSLLSKIQDHPSFMRRCFFRFERN